MSRHGWTRSRASKFFVGFSAAADVHAKVATRTGKAQKCGHARDKNCRLISPARARTRRQAARSGRLRGVRGACCSIGPATRQGAARRQDGRWPNAGDINPENRDGSHPALSGADALRIVRTGVAKSRMSPASRPRDRLRTIRAATHLVLPMNVFNLSTCFVASKPPKWSGTIHDCARASLI
jgi:hypothetical protein